MSVGVNVSPRAVVAATYQQLERKMSSMVFRRGTYIKFHSIQQMKNGRWIGWYDTEHKTSFLKKDNDNGISKE